MWSAVWDWITGAIVPAVYSNAKYNRETKLQYEKNFMAQYNRVIGGMFLIQKRRLRTNSGPCADGENAFPEGNCGACNTKFDTFYPVCYTNELDESSEVTFGPKAVPEATFDAQAAYAADAGIAAGAETCPPAEEMCPRCLLPDPLLFTEPKNCEDPECSDVSCEPSSGMFPYNDRDELCKSCKPQCIAYYSIQDADRTSSISEKPAPATAQQSCFACLYELRLMEPEERDYSKRDEYVQAGGALYFKIDDTNGCTAAKKSSCAATFAEQCFLPYIDYRVNLQCSTICVAGDIAGRRNLGEGWGQDYFGK